MSKNFVQNASMRRMLLSGYRLWARAQIWRSGPRIFVNSIPKAGTHLVTAELDKFASLQNSRLHLQAHEIGSFAGRDLEDASLDLDKVRRQIATVRRGQFFSAHLPWSAPLAEMLRGSDVRSIFVTRDPRDILVSRLHYIKGLKRHPLHAFVAGLPSDQERLRVLVEGRSGSPFIRPMAEALSGFLAWTTDPAVLTVRFEDLVGERGGGTREAKAAALAGICRHCELPADRLEAFAASAPKATPTLRAGKANAWRGAIPPEVAALIHARCGPQIAAMGYPES
jgi:hypothetical protein